MNEFPTMIKGLQEPISQYIDGLLKEEEIMNVLMNRLGPYMLVDVLGEDKYRIIYKDLDK